MPSSISWKKLVKKFRALGFDGPYSGGRHLFMTKGAKRLIIPNPHKGDISKSLVSELLRQAGVSGKDWNT
ncbi:hypothetical protein BK004_04440 [bacterium CG10_46_32]|nr:MAG: hypothetical protein BK004_04440 [bacterium CG10_46_32]PIR55758.1 MAG: hypothetical protein COU73_04480 [Parcubacteria group bacterium CG10_big_fil_rev_8_21_14_0_10_46_32]